MSSYWPSALLGGAPNDTIARYSKKNVAVNGPKGNGNFVLTLPVSKQLLKDAAYQTGEEFTHLSYTAVTCDPDEFPKKYDLRPRRYNRRLENFVICIVSDGRTKINPRVLTVLGVMGCYMDGLPRSSVNGDPVTGHIFEFTTQIAVDRDMAVRTRKMGIFPTQIIFVLKEKNAKKINSHKWFFNAVCEVIAPEVTMLLDVGTKPSAVSFYHLYRSFERDPRIGGACGEIAAELGASCTNLLNPLVATQNFEYKMSNILDKPLESVFGYISVLPGAFSAYRYKALQGEPLYKYFLGEKPGADIFTSNLYLAEDRILCFELITKKHEAWRLKYVKSAVAETDVPSTLPELISQRRRWLNGSFFASVHALTHYTQIFQSPHSFFQKFVFTLQFIYNAVSLAFSWISLANFYLAFYFLFKVSNTVNPNSLPFGTQSEIVDLVMRELYIFSIIAIFISSLSNRPQGSKWLYYGLSVLFSIIMSMMLFMGVWSIYQAVVNFKNRGITSSGRQETPFEYFRTTTVFRDLVVSIMSTYGLYFVASIIHLDPWHCITSMIQYLLILPTYNNIFMIYAFCNLHDVSWGTKGDNAVVDDKPAVVQKTANGEQVFEVEIPSEEQDIDAAWAAHIKQLASNRANPEVQNSKRDVKTKSEDVCKEFRTRVVLSWIITNSLIIALFTNDAFINHVFKPSPENSVNPYLTFIFWSVAVLSAIRFIGCCVYMVIWWGEKLSGAARGGSRKVHA
ncbi:chitin synthase [Batrachochytrium dendrobatidis JEL423]|uniref:Chitin synthase n=1 Tax=Batrachochytrium dendrobatidis (strain JEL423) TaxID=403673 RepID=A0A177WNE9_BATDL|nr:chitin synthase [Batrachochytrium dendrobatidis JEL423]